MPIIGLDDELVEKKPITEEDIIQYENSRGENFDPLVEIKEEVTLSKRKIQSLREIYSEVVVNDYGDGYHKSEEELASENAFYHLYRKIDGKKKRYNILSDYIQACRDCLDFLYAVADKQTVYTRKEFLILWGKGKIKINGMYLPRYTGKDRKRLNAKPLAEYIISGGDPEEYLKPIEAVIIDSEEMLKEQRELLFTRKEHEALFADGLDPTDENTKALVDTSAPATYKGLAVAIPLDEKTDKWLQKKNPGMAELFKDSIRSGCRTSEPQRMIWDMETDDFENMEKYEKAYGKTKGRMPEFTGSFLSDKAYKKYEEELAYWQFHKEKIHVDGKYKTREEINDEEVKATLESMGVNIRALWKDDQKAKEARLQKRIEKEKKNEDRLRKQLAESTERRKDMKKLRTMSESELAEYKKKKAEALLKKERKKGKKKRKAKADGLSDAMAKARSGGKAQSFKDYKKDSLDWSWSNIRNGGEGNE